MSLAATSPPVRDLSQCYTGFVRASRQLHEDLGVNIQMSPLPPQYLGDYDEAIGVLQLRESATLIDQIWVMRDLWWKLTVGAWASTGAVTAPLLYLVPTPPGYIDAAQG